MVLDVEISGSGEANAGASLILAEGSFAVGLYEGKIFIIISINYRCLQVFNNVYVDAYE